MDEVEEERVFLEMLGEDEEGRIPEAVLEEGRTLGDRGIQMA